MCPEHGGPMEECADPHKLWFPQRSVCYATMEQAAANWRYDQLHEKRPYHDGSFTSWSKDRSAEYPYHYRDGVTILTTPVDLSPDDDFLGAGSPAEKSVGEHPEAAEHARNKQHD